MQKTLTAALTLGLGLGLAGVGIADDVDKGEKVFKKCAACHAVGEDAKNKVGPQLNNIIGAEAGKVEGYKYSSDMAESGLTWDEETLTNFLRKPKDVIAKTKMTFAGLKKDEDIEDVIAYLKTFSEGTEGEEAAETTSN